jgi:hypothetical protein
MTTASNEAMDQQADEPYRRRSLFIYHAVIAALCLMMLWFSGASRSILPEMITVIWVSLLLIQGIRIFIGERSEQAIEREWRRYYDDPFPVDEKPKRTLRFTDDTEIESIGEEAQEHKALQGV